MGFSYLATSLVGLAFMSSFQFAALEDTASTASAVSEAAAISCGTGTKIGKTPVSLRQGGKPGCYNISLASKGKKLLISNATKTCMACHSLTGITPPKTMISNLKAQGYTLKPASIILAFNAHSSEMLGSSITMADAKAISNYLQSIR